MARPQTDSGRPLGTSVQGRGPPAARLAAAHAGAAAHTAAVERRRAPDPVLTRRASAWIVQCVIAATSAFALLDLYLLMVPSHH